MKFLENKQPPKKSFKAAALSSAALMIATIIPGAALADAAIKLHVGGHFRLSFAAVVEEDAPGAPGAGRRNHKIGREAEIYFRGKTVLDNGLKIGVDVQLEAETCADQIDESYIYFEGRFGRLNIGSNDGASDLMHVGPPSALPQHGYDGPTEAYLLSGDNSAGLPETTPGLSGDAEKLAYFTPRLGGFQFGVSYTPDNCEEGTVGPNPCGGSYSGATANNTPGQYSNITEIGANFEREWGKFALSVSTGFAQGKLEVAAAGMGDHQQYAAGLNFSYGGITLGVAYKHDDLGATGANTNRQDYSIGALYALGDWEFSAGVAWAVSGEGAGAGRDKSRLMEAALNYNLGPGITLAAGLIHYRFTDNAGVIADENDGFALTFGTMIRF